MSRLRIAALAAALSFASVAHAGMFGKGAPKAIELDPAAPAVLVPALKVEQADAMRAARRVAIGNFRILVVHEGDATATAQAGLGQTHGRASQTVVWTLAGLDPARLQAMADQAYTAFEGKLRAAGLEVVPLSELAGKPGAERLAGSPQLSRVQRVEQGDLYALMVTPSQVAPKLALGAVAKDAQGRKLEDAVATGGKVAAVAGATGRFGGLGKLGGLAGSAMGAMKTAKAMGAAGSAISDSLAMHKLATETGIAIADFTVTVNFVDLKASGAGGFLDRIVGSDTAKVEALVRPTFVASDTRLQLAATGQVGTITLERPVVLAGNAFSEVRNATTKADTAGNVAGAVLSGLVSMHTGNAASSHRLVRREAMASGEYDAVVLRNIEALEAALVAAITGKAI